MRSVDDMALWFYCFLVSAAYFNRVHGQGTAPNGEIYFCVPPGICPDAGGIDPRIVTPGATPEQGSNLQQLIEEVFFNEVITTGQPQPAPVSCPAGRFPCYAQRNCGLRATSSNTDGPAPVGSYPWQAFLMGPGGYIGSGSLISPYHVLTAAHKTLAFLNNPGLLRVFFGVNIPPPNATSPNSVAAQIFNLSNYNNFTLKNDISIIRLATPISLLNPSAVNTICLPPGTATPTTYTAPPQRCVVSGWGQIEPTNSLVPTPLKQVFVTTTDIDTCEKGFSGRVDTTTYLDKTGGQLCAGGEAQKDACFQDGGAPLACGLASGRPTVSGIVIWGKSCGQPGVFGVYTNVPFYRGWILATILQPIP